MSLQSMLERHRSYDACRRTTHHKLAFLHALTSLPSAAAMPMSASAHTYASEPVTCSVLASSSVFSWEETSIKHQEISHLCQYLLRNTFARRSQVDAAYKQVQAHLSRGDKHSASRNFAPMPTKCIYASDPGRCSVHASSSTSVERRQAFSVKAVQPWLRWCWLAKEGLTKR